MLTPTRDAAGFDQSIELHIHPETGIVVSVNWHGEQPDADGGAWPFAVEAPAEAVALLHRNAMPGHSLRGYLSPPVRVTITEPQARRSAGIPAAAAFYAFAYPLECLAGQYDTLVASEGRSDGWLYFLLLGGWCYFDEHRNLISTNAIVLTRSPLARLTLQGPFTPQREAVDHLRLANRLQNITLRPLLEQGFQRFGWVNPGEAPGGVRLRASHESHLETGCFIYERGDGSTAVAYSLVRSPPWSLLRELRRCLGLSDEATSAVHEATAADGTTPAGTVASLEGTTAAPPLADLARSESHQRLVVSMASAASAAQITATAAKQLQADLGVCVCGYMRSHSNNPMHCTTDAQ